MWGDDLDVAVALADRADAITMAAFTGRPLAFVTKADGSPVTDTDEFVERELRAELAARRPDDGFLGEETGEIGPSPRRWIVDPVDGTVDFAAGGRRWATQIALEVEDRIVVGVTSAPALGARWWAARDVGAYGRTPGSGEPRPLRVSDVEAPGAVRWTWSPAVADLPDRFRPAAERLAALGPYRPATASGVLMVAEGAVDACLALAGAPWDYAAFVAIVETAGGTFSYLDGSRTLAGARPALFTNGRIHAQALAAVGAEA